MFVDIMMENVSLLEADMQIKGMETTFPYSHDTHPLIFVLCCIFSYAGCVALMTVSRPVHYSWKFLITFGRIAVIFLRVDHPLIIQSANFCDPFMFPVGPQCRATV